VIKLKQHIFIIEEGFTGYICDKDYDLPVSFNSKEDAEKYAKYLNLDYLIVDKPEVAY
jgi:hypothetical protein